MLINFKKITVGVLLGFLVFSGAFVFVPKTAYAEVPVVVVAEPQSAIWRALDTVWEKSKNFVKFAMTNALIAAADTMAQRAAANAATFIVSGGNGQSALAYITSWNNWHDNVLMDSVSDSLNRLSTEYLGFGLCAPINPSIDLRIRLGVARLYAPKPSCSFNQAYNAAIASKNNITSGNFLNAVALNFEMGSSPLSVAVNTNFAIVNKATKAATDWANQRLTSPYKPITDAISGNVKTPADIVQQVGEQPWTDAKINEQRKWDVAITETDLWAAVGTNALKIFSSTLMSKAIDKYVKGGTLTGKDILCGSSAGQSFDLCHGIVNQQGLADSGGGSTGVALASAYFAQLFSPPVSQIDDYSPVGELSSCPGQDSRSIWNCAMDQGLVSALSEQDNGYLSVADAVAKGYLHADWELIADIDPRNDDFDCYTKGYCYTNLMKLRRMRIVPVGWEMAAQAAGTTPMTLAGAIKSFNDPASPYYHLIDPDWILKVPVTQCRAQVNGQTLAAPDTSERAQVCVDLPSCIKEDASGKCISGFGYCTREHNVWKIDAIECAPQYASCQSYTDSNGKDISLLKNTVDIGICSADNVGCKPYAAVGSPAGWTNGTAAVYLTSKATECDAKSAGCRSLKQMKTVDTANLIPNSSLETPTADGAMARGWGNLGGIYVRDGYQSFDGIAAFGITTGGLKLGGYNYEMPTDPEHYTEVQVEPNSLYTFSFYAKSGGVSNAASAIIKAFDTPFYSAESHTCPDGTSWPTCLQNMSGDVAYLPTCTTTGTGTPNCRIGDNEEFGVGVPASSFFLNFPLSAGYERYTMTFATSSGTRYLGFEFNGTDYYIDAIQLEKGPTATAYHNGGSDDFGANVALLAPPSYLGCTGEDAADAGKGCGAYSRVCRQSEVGCDEFTPAGGAGTPITAVTSSGDSCPAECVGYSTFKQEPTIWANAQFPLYFIPTTARSCSRAEVGCDEFTNLDAVSGGGESKTYFTYIRSCRMPDAPNNGTYFTWEGSDASGYQLRSFVLVNNVTAGDSTMFNVINSEGVNFVQKLPGIARGPAYLAGTDQTTCTRDIYHPVDGSPSLNPDCRELFDADGNTFYRLLNATVTATDECKTFRKTISSQLECANSGGFWSAGASSCDYFVYQAQSASCSASANGCRAYTGNQGNNTKLLFSSNFENKQTDGWSGGVLSNESTSVTGQSYGLNNTEASKPMVDASGKPLMNAGHSYMLTIWAKGSGTLNIALNGNIVSAAGVNPYFADAAGVQTPRVELTTEWQRYSLGPVIANWTPDTGDTLRVRALNAAGLIYFDNIELTETQDQFYLVQNSWVTPGKCDQTTAGQSLPQAQLGCAEYQNKGGSTVNLKSFDHLCRAQAVGCEAFTDTQLTETPFASYKNVLCTINGAPDPVAVRDCKYRGQKVCTVPANETGCRFDFEGSGTQLVADGTYAYSVEPDTFTIPPDATVYLVNDGSKTCSVTAVGCTALGDNDVNTLGKCTLASVAGNATACPAGATGSAIQCYVGAGQSECSYRIPWTVNGKSVYRMIDPATIKKNLCIAPAVSCQAWTTANGDTKYFKDPGAALCEYRDNDTYNGKSVSGWFKQGTSEPCDPTFIKSGKELGIRRNLDPEFPPNQFAGVCKPEVSGCTEFTDHADTGAIIKDRNGNKVGDEFPSGRPFYYINDNKIKDASALCNSKVSQKQGCLALDQTDNSEKTMNTLATYAKSDDAGFAMVDPISDAGNDANIILKVLRDRVCTEWLECNTEQMVADVTTGRDSTRCLGLGSCLEKGADGRCLTWGSLEPGYPVLSRSAYVDRDVTSAGSDYSGFSIPNLPPVFAFKQYGVNSQQLNVNNVPVDQTCKAYPETDSPFPTGDTRRNINLCEGADCECSYRKVSYGGGTIRYYGATDEAGVKKDFNNGEIKDAICDSGFYEGEECSVYATGDRSGDNLSCAKGNDEGTCKAISKIDSFVGIKGYCLETDKTVKISSNASGGSDACLTWLPIDQPNGRDRNNLFASAGFLPKPGQEMYCAAPLKVCVPNECGNNYHEPIWKTDTTVPPVCTQLQNADISFISSDGNEYSLPDGCFNGCYLGDENNRSAVGDCVSKQNSVCGKIVTDFCSSFGYIQGQAFDLNDKCSQIISKASECNGWDPDSSTNADYCKDAFEACKEYIEPRRAFCAQLESGNCFDKYGNNVQCSEDSQSAGAAFSSTFCGRNTLGMSYPSCNNDVGDCHTPEYYFQFNDLYDATGENEAKTVGNINGATAKADIIGCEAIGKTTEKFCGNGEACGLGESCVPVNNLTAKQTEYTKQESREGLALVEFVYRAPSEDGQSQNPVEEFKITDDNRKNFTSYSTITTPGSHSYLDSTGIVGIPTLSSNSLEFRPSSNPEAVTGQWMDFRGYDVPNYSSASKSLNPIIGSYPNDLVGMYYFGYRIENTPGSISIDYDLVSPSLLFASQVDRVTLRVLSYQKAGLCRYAVPEMMGPTGECLEISDDGNTAYPEKTIARWPIHDTSGGDEGSYGYYLYDPEDDWQISSSVNCEFDPSVDDETRKTTCQTSNTAPKDMILTSGNGWKSQASASEGTVTISLRLSQSEPKRVIGVHIDATDNNKGGYIYISNVDFKMRGSVAGAICGEVAYAGSSNPLALSSMASGGSYGVANTSALTSTSIPVEDSAGKRIATGDPCTPWGAFSIANPATIVTMATSGKCELSKGSIFNGAAEILKIFAKALGVGLFNDDKEKQVNYFAYSNAKDKPQELALRAQSNYAITNGIAPSFGRFILNGKEAGAPIVAVGSQRVDLKFWVSANANQMPLKRVYIGWGDDRYDSGPDNFFKNRKESCSDPGDTAANCDTAPFAFSHVYSCPASASFPSLISYPEINVSVGDSICSYRPTVTVTDNWNVSSAPFSSPVEVIVAAKK